MFPVSHHCFMDRNRYMKKEVTIAARLANREWNAHDSAGDGLGMMTQSGAINSKPSALRVFAAVH